MRIQGIATAQALAERLGVERSSISRRLGELGSSVLRIGAARSARYTLRRNVRGRGNRWPLHRIDEAGRAHQIGVLNAVHGGFVWETGGSRPDWFNHGYTDGVFPGLPFPLSDVKPQGFLGRMAARAFGPALGSPSDPRDWQDDDILAFLLVHGSDMPGDMLVGDAMLTEAMADRTLPSEEFAAHEIGAHYAARATEVMQGGSIGSSAGGEQPKFTATVRDDSGAVLRVLVKYSAPMAAPGGRRWADLLAAEHHALAVLAANGDAVAGTRLIDSDDRRFLEVARFDRTERGGRRGVVTLQAIEAGLLDESAADWPAVSAAVETDGLLSAADSRTLRRRWCFGQMIANNDMHLGNAAVWFGDTIPFRLAPAYDMLPMLYAPGPQGEIVPRTFALSQPLPRMREDWNSVLPLAIEFWCRVRDDSRISDDFRGIAAAAESAVAKTEAR
jgi:hypothetical protein